MDADDARRLIDLLRALAEAPIDDRRFLPDIAELLDAAYPILDYQADGVWKAAWTPDRMHRRRWLHAALGGVQAALARAGLVAAPPVGDPLHGQQVGRALASRSCRR